jgi:hypothetical protein
LERPRKMDPHLLEYARGTRETYTYMQADVQCYLIGVKRITYPALFVTAVRQTCGGTWSQKLSSKQSFLNLVRRLAEELWSFEGVTVSATAKSEVAKYLPNERRDRRRACILI